MNPNITLTICTFKFGTKQLNHAFTFHDDQQSSPHLVNFTLSPLPICLSLPKVQQRLCTAALPRYATLLSLCQHFLHSPSNSFWHVYVLGGVCSLWPCNQNIKTRDVIASGTDTGNVWRMMLEHWNLLETLTLARAMYTCVGAECGRGGRTKDIRWGDN